MNRTDADDAARFRFLLDEDKKKSQVFIINYKHGVDNDKDLDYYRYIIDIEMGQGAEDDA